MVASIQPACLVYRVQMRPAFIHPRIDISGRLANLKASANRSRNHIRFNHARFNSVQQQTLPAAFVADIFGRYPLRLRKWPNSSLEAAPFPDWLEDILSRLPTNVNRRRGAEEISQYLFPVSHRSLETWPLPTRRVNGQAIVSTRALFALAFQKYSASPVVMGGRRKLAFVK